MPVTLLKDTVRGRGDRMVVALLATGIILLIVAIVAAAVTLGSITEDTDAVEATLQTQATISRISTLNEQTETGRRGYLINGDRSFGAITRIATDALQIEVDRAAPMVQGFPDQQERFARLSQMVDERQAIVDRLLALPPERLSDAAAENFDLDPGVQLTRKIRTLALEMLNVEKDRLSLRNRSQLDSLKRFYAVGGIALLLLVAVMATVVVVMVRHNRAIADAEAELRVANEGLEGAVAERTTDLRRANAEIQRFAYIVSHDLRSPLVNVLGFTSEMDAARAVIQKHLDNLRESHPELATKDLAYAVEEDLPEALGFIRTSTEKMDRLINSILDLSRQGRRVLTPENLDMRQLTGNVADTLYQRAQEEDATILIGELPEVESDRMAVEQIMSNLLENAIKYLSPDRKGEIRIEGGRSFGQVHFDVIDNGRGIAPNDHERVFDLFRRSGKQDKPGEGIGLANVRALAHRLGGNVTVESELDRGATFRLSLPTRFRPVDDQA
ncbi:GHKL domain-containing protein [Croceicoccus ponticola]|uniref:histidine kinase n=1 Tax=Croceicoccus ponticola TaxID=2217664 RepID=A0A437H0E3_9SPHN|nr:sensor histidine kinase [Croceicoccus ponticola]RVQ69100.1 GHKL domain-containing protein [Croceicoccus ponticola]